MQLFTHLLSSYLQGMGDFFSALPTVEMTDRTVEMMDRTTEMTPAYLVTTLMMHLGSRPASLAYLT